MSTTHSPAADAETLDAIRDRIDYFVSPDHSRVADLLLEAQYLLRRGDFIARVEAALEDAGVDLAEALEWSRKGDEVHGHLHLRVRPESREEYATVARVLVPFLDGYGCDDDQPEGVDWTDGNPYTAFGGVTITETRMM